MSSELRQHLRTQHGQAFVPRANAHVQVMHERQHRLDTWSHDHTSTEMPLSVPAVGPDSTSGVIPASDRLGSCGHELDEPEWHYRHYPDCVAPGSPECLCPLVCSACCSECCPPNW